MSKQSRPATTVLLTRPALQSARFAQQLAGLAADVLIAPLFAARFMACPSPDDTPVDGAVAALFTSETGVAGALAGGHVRRGALAYCVGSATARAAEQAGYDAHDAQGDWRDLARLVQAHCPRGPLAFFCAQDAPEHLQTALIQAGYPVQRLEVYAQDILPLDPAAAALLAKDAPVILPLFSPRSAAVLARHAKAARAPLWVAAISAASLAAFDAPYARAAVADRPNAAQMQRVIAKLLQ